MRIPLCTAPATAASPDAGPRRLPDSKEAQLTVPSDNVIISAHFVQKQKSNPVHYGNTVQLDDGTLVTPYSYADPARAQTNDIAGSCLELARWKLPPGPGDCWIDHEIQRERLTPAATPKIAEG